MKKLVIVLALGLAASCAVWAQSKASSASAVPLGKVAASSAPKAPASSAPSSSGGPTAQMVCTEYKDLARKNDGDFKTAVNQKKISAKEHEDYVKRDAALQKQHDDAAKDKKLTKAECDKLLDAAKKEEVALKEMVAVGAAVESCFADFKKTSAEADQVFDSGVKDKKISPVEQARYKQTDKLLQAQYDDAMKNGRITRKECQDLLAAAKKELDKVKAMAAK